MNGRNYNRVAKEYATLKDWHDKWYYMGGSDPYLYRTVGYDTTVRIRPSVDHVGYCSVNLVWYNIGYPTFSKKVEDVPILATYPAYMNLKKRLWKHLDKNKFYREATAKENLKLLKEQFNTNH